MVIAEATRRLVGTGFDLEAWAELAQRHQGCGEFLRFSASAWWRAASRPAVVPRCCRWWGANRSLPCWSRGGRWPNQGEGQGVLLVGEAGIGKSRIMRALLDTVAGEPHTRIRYQCSPYHRDSALWPVIQQLGHAAGFARDDLPDARLDKLDVLLGRAVDAADAVAPLIADLLGSTVRAATAARLTPQAQRARTLEALIHSCWVWPGRAGSGGARGRPLDRSRPRSR